MVKKSKLRRETDQNLRQKIYRKYYFQKKYTVLQNIKFSQIYAVFGQTCEIWPKFGQLAKLNFLVKPLNHKLEKITP